MYVEEYLKGEIRNGMSLSQVVDVFEKMCGLPLEIEADDDCAFLETLFDGEHFCFYPARQFSNGEGEYFQLHADVMFEKNDRNRSLEELVRSDEENLDGGFFEYIRRTESYRACENEKNCKGECVF